MAASCDKLELKSYAVKVSVDREITPPQGLSFQSILFATSEKGGVLSADDRVRIIFSPSEAAEIWGNDSEVYMAAHTAFSQVVSPTYIKIGYIDDGETLLEGVQAINNGDCNFYGLALHKSYRTRNAELVALAKWVAGERKLLSLTTNDATHKSTDLSADCIEKQLRDQDVEHTLVNYSSHVDVYPCVAQLAVDLVNNLDNPNSYFTSKFKFHAGIPVENVSSSEYVALTGFVGGEGYSTTSGRRCNLMINSQTPMYAEGMMVNGEFIDRVIFRHWLEQNFEIAKFSELKTNPSIPQSDAGYAQIVASLVRVIKRAQANGGLLTSVRDAEGNEVEAYTIDSVPRAEVTDANISNRIMPEIKVKVYYSDAIHYTSTRVQSAQ